MKKLHICLKNLTILSLDGDNTILLLVVKKLHINSSPPHHLKAISTTTAKNANASSFGLPQVHLTFVQSRNQLDEIKILREET